MQKVQQAMVVLLQSFRMSNQAVVRTENGRGNQLSGSAGEISSDGEVVPISEQSFLLKDVKVESQSTLRFLDWHVFITNRRLIPHPNLRWNQLQSRHPSLPLS
jgi:hypothetical protein